MIRPSRSRGGESAKLRPPGAARCEFPLDVNWRVKRSLGRPGNWRPLGNYLVGRSISAGEPLFSQNGNLTQSASSSVLTDWEPVGKVAIIPAV